MKLKLLASLAIPATALASLATPAVSAEAPSIDLSCSTSGRTVTCSWDAVDGAEAYRVVRVARRGAAGVIRGRRTTQTSFTREFRRGRYVFVVQAVDGERNVVAHSDRERVVVR